MPAADGLRLRAHRELPHLSADRCAAAVSAAEGIEVRHVMNITDVDDKIIRNAAAAGVPIGEYTRSSSRRFLRIWIRCAWSGRR
jgi:cysteinyl-tRNA synthetase